MSCSLLPSISHFVGIPPSISLSLHKPFIPRLSPIKPDLSQCRCHRRDPPPPAICAHSTSKPRARKKAKSNADLCNDLREFLSTVGLPEDHVPSTKELLQHGRQDLANIVRRRGYKLIKELIAASAISRRTDSDKEESLVIENKINGEGQSKEEDMHEDASLSCEVPVMRNCSNSVNGVSNNSTSASDRENLAIEQASTSSLQEKVGKFIYNGELDAIEGDNYEIAADGGEELSESESLAEESTPLDTAHSGRLLDRSNTAKTSNCTLSLKQGIHLAKDNSIRREDYISSAELFDGNGCDELEMKIQGRVNQVEVNRLKWMLHQKELELSRLKEEIEKEKV